MGLVFRIFGLLRKSHFLGLGFRLFFSLFFRVVTLKTLQPVVYGLRKFVTNCTRIASLYLCGKCAKLTQIGFEKTGFFNSVFCAVPAETKLETENLIGTRLRWFCSNVEIMKKKGGSRGSRFTNLDKISISSDGLFGIFCRFLRKRSSKWFFRGGGWVPNCFEPSHAST